MNTTECADRYGQRFLPVLGGQVGIRIHRAMNQITAEGVDLLGFREECDSLSLVVGLEKPGQRCANLERCLRLRLKLRGLECEIPLLLQGNLGFGCGGVWLLP